VNKKTGEKKSGEVKIKKIKKIGFIARKKMKNTIKEKVNENIKKENEIIIHTENSKIQESKITKNSLLLRIFKKSFLVLVMILSHFRSLFFFI
jgi:CRISPR/Cas system CSM-associated protein Csm4 (group 5 of RAMP superfamily)